MSGAIPPLPICLHGVVLNNYQGKLYFKFSFSWGGINTVESSFNLIFSKVPNFDHESTWQRSETVKLLAVV